MKITGFSLEPIFDQPNRLIMVNGRLILKGDSAQHRSQNLTARVSKQDILPY